MIYTNFERFDKVGKAPMLLWQSLSAKKQNMAEQSLLVLIYRIATIKVKLMPKGTNGRISWE